jgi:hypothetical protein
MVKCTHAVVLCREHHDITDPWITPHNEGSKIPYTVKSLKPEGVSTFPCDAPLFQKSRAAFLKVLTLCPFPLPVRPACRWRRKCCFGGNVTGGRTEVCRR